MKTYKTPNAITTSISETDKLVLGIDSATNTGWAICKNGEILDYGEFNCRKLKKEKAGYLFERYYDAVFSIIVPLSKTGAIFNVNYEMTHHRGRWATTYGYAWITRLMEICDTRDINLVGIRTPVLKKLATGKGNATKEEMVLYANKLIPSTITSNDIADAIHLSRV